jgi:[mycofactocin precursor peptide]-tyrosine decarboxylase / 3-amino-5-[(4-hydroxyphenyl)methyl]-4,4-dimethylpyrrolidin-2-one synthase
MALAVFLTNACNLHCKYCFNLDRLDAPQIPLADIVTILNAAYARGNRYVTITGGEPFLYHDLFKVLDHAHGLGFWITILSHGGLIDSSCAERLKKYWRVRLRISLDGPDRKTQDELRGEGTFDSTIRSIARLLDHGLNVGIGVTVSEVNLDSVDALLWLCLEMRVAFVRCIPVARIRRGKAARVTTALHRTLLHRLVAFTIANMDRIDLYPLAAQRLPASVEVLATRHCMAGKCFFGVTPDKRVLPCPLISFHPQHPEVPIISFRDGSSFEQLSDRMDALFSSFASRLSGACADCEFAAVCQGGCLAEKLSFDRDLSDEQPVCPRFLLQDVARDHDARDMARVVRSWMWASQNSLEECNGYGCLRKAPYWNINFSRSASRNHAGSRAE